MSATLPSSDDLAARDILTQIDRNIAETGKLIAEQAKLNAEHTKLFAEQRKLTAEAEKFRRERFLAPVLALVATLGAIAALAPIILRTLSGH